MRIYLLGFSGCGKSTLAKKLAKQLNMPYLDLDTCFENEAGMSISSFFQQFGEEAFRKKESELLQNTAQIEHCVIALGGGTPCYNDNMQWIKAHGWSVYIVMNEKALYDRVKNHVDKRPLLAGAENLQACIRQKLCEREPYYMQADMQVQGVNINVRQLAQEIKEKGGF